MIYGKLSYEGFKKLKCNSTTGGFLYKRYVEDDFGKVKYLDKSGTLYNKRFSNKEPVIEVICYEIASYLGISCAKYYLIEEELMLSPLWIKQNILISRTEWFLSNDDRLIHAKDIIGNELLRKPDAYKKFLEIFPHLEGDLNNMILFDYLINNTDRHFKNFAVIQDTSTNNYRFAPLYDHGSSLGVDYDSEYLEAVMDEDIDDYDLDLDVNIENCDVSKTFSSTHKASINLIKNTQLLHATSLDDILKIVDKYSMYLDNNLVGFIKELLSRRYQFLIEKFGGK